MKENKKNIPQTTFKDVPFFYSSYYNHKKWFLKEDYNLAISLSKSFLKTYNKLQKHYKTYQTNYKIAILYAKTQLLQNQKDYNLTPPPFYAHCSFKADYYYLEAQKDIYITDLQNASYKISKALKIYKKLGYLYECAECYQSMSKIYKLCGLKDISLTLLYEAISIYKTLNCHPKIAEATAYLGIHELEQENYDNSIQYFNDALKICQTHHLDRTICDINNWKALSYFLQNDYKNTLKVLEESITSKHISNHAKSFNLEMIARTYYKTNKYSNAQKYTDLSLDEYKKQKNKYAILELTYLKAEIYFLQKKYSKSKEILINLIKQKTEHFSLYYPANAYTLLGLVYQKENNLKKALNMFKLALDLEKSKNRPKGAIVDYNNLAETTLKLGDKEASYKYLNLALELAKDLKDNNLTSYLEKKLKK